MSWNSGFSKGIMIYLPKCNHDFAILPCNHWPLFFCSGCWAQGFGTIITVTTFVMVFGDIVKVIPLFPDNLTCTPKIPLGLHQSQWLGGTKRQMATSMATCDSQIQQQSR